MISTLAHWLLPRQSNNHKAQLIKPFSLLLITAFVILFQGASELVSIKYGQILGYAANISVTEVERLTNLKRAENGLPSLTDNPILDEAALAKGRDMLAKGYWAHVAPDGTQPWAFFVASHYNYRYAGENLARDFGDASSAVNAWMASTTHRENMLSANYKEIGIGVVEGKLGASDTTIIVQFFGTKMGDTLPAQPVVEVPAAPPLALTSAPTTLVASSTVSPLTVTRYLSLGLIGVLMAVVAIDGFLVNRRKIFRIAGHMPAHLAFLGMILTIIIIAKAGRII